MDQFEFLTKWSQSNIEPTLFYLLAIWAIPLSLGVLLDKAIIRSGFMLIGVFGAISGIFLLLQAQFLALAQLMIYAVGITLVVVIALMLTNPKLERERSVSIPKNRGAEIAVAILLFLTIYLSLRSESWPINNTEAMSWDNIQTIGVALTTTYALPFEFASVLLLAALIGAILLAKADDSDYTESTSTEKQKTTGKLAPNKTK